MEGAAHKVTILLGGDLTLSPDTHTTRVANDLANHVLSSMALGRLQIAQVGLLPTNGPLGYIIRPDVGGHAGRSFTITAIKMSQSRSRSCQRRLTLDQGHTLDPTTVDSDSHTWNTTPRVATEIRGQSGVQLAMLLMLITYRVASGLRVDNSFVDLGAF